MTIRKIDELVKLGSHPLEDHFDIESNSTEIVTTKRTTEIEEYADYDKKDKELEQDYQMIMDSSLDLVDKIKEHIDGGAEAKFLARLVEVAGQQLNVALSAAEKKAKLKDNKDKFNHKKLTSNTNKTVNTANFNISMNRNDMLRLLLEQNEELLNSNNSDIIDAEIIDPQE